MPPPLQEFEDDESELQDTLAHQVVSGARDAQGIPWSATPYTRADYRVRGIGNFEMAVLPCGDGGGRGIGSEGWRC